jgi:hypothetical protein
MRQDVSSPRSVKCTVTAFPRISRLSDLYENKTITPDDVLLEFENFPGGTIPIIVVDEFDRLKDARAKVLLSDTIKLISDEAVNATFFIVGVSDAVEDLLPRSRVNWSRPCSS